MQPKNYINSKTKIAIIGGTSFIGNKLLSVLKKKKLKIIATYNNKKNIDRNSKITWKKLNLIKEKKNYFKYLNSPDIVVNLAWPDIPNYLLKKHFKTFNLQKKLNYNLINNGLKNLIMLGTCYEYGKISGKLNESLKPKPIIPYAKAKLRLLQSIISLKKKKSFKFSWLRPFFVYGNNKKRKTLFSLIKDYEKDEIKELKVCGELVRDFVPVNFLCKSILKIINLNEDIGVLNICSGKPIKLKKFVKMNIKDRKKFNLVGMNGKNPNGFEANKFWGCNKKLKKIIK
jgi:nucleoside-diphosphate-sugar epimerase